jgi:hypothetical protein
MFIRRHLSYANVAATMALVFSMAGGAMAAKHYLITSTGQISPKVLKKLKGHNGKNGATGPTGSAGAKGTTGEAGPRGERGEAGPFPSTLPSGKTITGTWSIAGLRTAENNAAETAISFPFPLASSVTVHIVAAGASPPAGCSGTAASPGAAAGNLCIFEGYHENVTAGSTAEFEPIEGINNVSGATGVVLYVRGASTGYFEDEGTYAVTAS